MAWISANVRTDRRATRSRRKSAWASLGAEHRSPACGRGATEPCSRASVHQRTALATVTPNWGAAAGREKPVATGAASRSRRIDRKHLRHPSLPNHGRKDRAKLPTNQGIPPPNNSIREENGLTRGAPNRVNNCRSFLTPPPRTCTARRRSRAKLGGARLPGRD